jgi:SAM-dependent methyltransferase
MSFPPRYQNPEFDDFAENYDDALEKGISVSGETKEFFAKGRVDWLRHCLDRVCFPVRHVLDFGCGTGTGTPFLLGLPNVEQLTGLEVSSKSLAVARRLYGSARVHFHLCAEFEPAGEVDLVFCNGVFHHIPPAERAQALRYIFNALKAGGVFALWENNPWNPGTHYVMRRIPFDRDAIMLSACEARQLLGEQGFDIMRTDFCFIFPRALRLFRPLERVLNKVPLGAQYQILARRPN